MVKSNEGSDKTLKVPGITRNRNAIFRTPPRTRSTTKLRTPETPHQTPQQRQENQVAHRHSAKNVRRNLFGGYIEMDDVPLILTHPQEMLMIDNEHNPLAPSRSPHIPKSP